LATHAKVAAGNRGRGRPKGSKNKSHERTKAEIAAAGITPLQYMLQVMRDPNAEKSRRDEMAKAAAPYAHPKLANVQHSTDPEKGFEVTMIERRIVKASDQHS
jgi:hypothetical protein